MINAKKKLLPLGLFILSLIFGLVCFFHKNEIEFTVSKEIKID